MRRQCRRGNQSSSSSSRKTTNEPRDCLPTAPSFLPRHTCPVDHPMADYVLLAFTDRERVHESPRLFKENFIGGKPFFSPHLQQEKLDAVLDSRRLTCHGCQRILAFLAQINCPLDDDSDRVIHVYACVNKECSDRKWLVTRTTAPVIELSPPQTTSNGSHRQEKEWLSGEDDWGDDEDDSKAAGDARVPPPNSSLKTQEATLLGPPVTIATSEQVNRFQSFYLIVEEEEYLMESERTSTNGKQVAIDAGSLADADVGPVSDAYEKFLIPGTDEVSNKFIKKMSRFPGQVIRYNLDGHPLLNQTTQVTPSACHACSGRRRFELQLTPGLINALSLNPGDSRETTEIDFGTVLVFTCEGDCASSTGVVIEEAIVLADADDEVLKAKVEELK